MPEDLKSENTITLCNSRAYAKPCRCLVAWHYSTHALAWHYMRSTPRSPAELRVCSAIT